MRYEIFSLALRSQPFCDSGDMKGLFDSTLALAVLGTLLMPGCFDRRMVRIDPMASKYRSSVKRLHGNGCLSSPFDLIDVDADVGVVAAGSAGFSKYSSFLISDGVFVVGFDRLVGDLCTSSVIIARLRVVIVVDVAVAADSSIGDANDMISSSLETATRDSSASSSSLLSRLKRLPRVSGGGCDVRSVAGGGVSNTCFVGVILSEQALA